MIPRPVKKMDNLVWTYSSGFIGAISNGNNSAVAFSTVGTLPTTLLRIRGNIACWLDGPDAPPVGLEIHVGIILVPEGSATTTQFEPKGDANAPWLYYDAFTIGYEETVTSPTAK
jgi:hypothetical protein